MEFQKELIAKSNAFVSLKDHKPNFSSNPKCRLINPAKSEMGKISKYFLEQLNSKVRDLSLVNQWQETSTVINWFKNIKNKKTCIFMQFDIEEFYPSISKELLLKAITYAKTLVNFSDEEINTIMHSRKSLLFNNTDIWIKKNVDPDFDVTMGSFDGVELCELVGLYILHILGAKYGKHRIGLYRDDGLACFGYTSGPQADRIRKDFIKIFKEDFNLSITCETNLKAVNFLDVTLNLTTGKYQPYNKPDNNPLYINILSNHPPNIIKNLPENISKRINTLSADETTFNKSKDLYNNALAESGFKYKITFQKQENTSTITNNTKKRKRKIIWFNPPFSLNVSTNIGKKFFSLLGKHFPKTHQLHKLFNRNNVKVSYSSLLNFKSVINGHNKNILNEQEKPSPCNCRDKTSCPLNGSCQHKNLVYSFKVSTPDRKQNHPHYIGLTEHTFKDRLYKHNNSFQVRVKEKLSRTFQFYMG